MQLRIILASLSSLHDTLSIDVQSSRPNPGHIGSIQACMGNHYYIILYSMYIIFEEVPHAGEEGTSIVCYNIIDLDSGLISSSYFPTVEGI